MHLRAMPAINAAGDSGWAGLSCCDFEQKAGCNDILFNRAE
jgi:hypothetical protein